MAVEWFYTANKHQMGPVSWEELRQLAESGLLKPHDMVWCDGMDEWVKAVKQQGLFTDDDGAAPSPRRSRQRDDEGAKPPPGKRSRTQEEDEDDDEDDERRKARRNKVKTESSKVALKVGLIIGGVILLLFGLGCGGFVFFW